MTVPISSSGATSERRSTIRTSRTTSSVIGMIVRASWEAASRTSFSTAVGPPTNTPRPPAACAAARIFGTSA